MNIKTSAFAVILATSALTSQAHNISCEVDMSFDIDLDRQEIVLSENNQQRVKIDADNQLYLNGEQQSLSAKQSQLLELYAKDIRQLLPAASEVAADASGLALEAITDVTKALMADEPAKAEKLVQRVEAITEGLRQHISSEHLRPSGIEDYFEGNEFEAEFEQLVEEAVTEFIQGSIGEMVSAAMRGDDEKVAAFEKRMERFGEEMETKFEAKAELLEGKAEHLCDLVEKIDSTENAFVKAFKKYDDYQLVTD